MNVMEIQDILEHLPHRYPFLWSIACLNSSRGKTIVATRTSL